MHRNLSIVILLMTLVVSGLISSRESVPRDWPELKEWSVLNRAPSRSGNWKYKSRSVLLKEGGQVANLRFGCGGGTEDFCQAVLFFETEKPILRFAGNCGGFDDPRIWMEPLPTRGYRKFLTYHGGLSNDSLGPRLEPGYWIWEWDGQSYTPHRP